MTEALKIAEEITGVKGPRLKMTPSAMKASSVFMGFQDKFLSVPDLYSAEMLRATAGVTYLGDNSKARMELGYEPRALQDGLIETLNILRKDIKK